MIGAFAKKTFCSRPGLVARRIRYPNPFLAPCQAKRLDLARGQALGDVLLCTPAMREVKQVNPSCYIRFFTDFVPLVGGLSYINEVHPIQQAPPDVYQLSYEGCIPPQGHLAKIIGDQLGVDVKDVKPDCVINPVLAESYRAMLAPFPKPHVLLLRRASRWTPNKDWPDRYWNVVAERVSRFGTVIEIGGITEESPGEYGSYLDNQARTSLEAASPHLFR